MYGQDKRARAIYFRWEALGRLEFMLIKQATSALGLTE